MWRSCRFVWSPQVISTLIWRPICFCKCAKLGRHFLWMLISIGHPRFTLCLEPFADRRILLMWLQYIPLFSLVSPHLKKSFPSAVFWAVIGMSSAETGWRNQQSMLSTAYFNFVQSHLSTKSSGLICPWWRLQKERNAKDAVICNIIRNGNGGTRWWVLRFDGRLVVLESCLSFLILNSENLLLGECIRIFWKKVVEGHWSRSYCHCCIQDPAAKNFIAPTLLLDSFIFNTACV